jgi:hypothetical protein
MRTAIALSLLIIAIMLIAARVPATPEAPDKRPMQMPTSWRRTADGWQRTDRWQHSMHVVIEPSDLPDPWVVSALELATAVAALAIGGNQQPRING